MSLSTYNSFCLIQSQMIDLVGDVYIICILVICTLTVHVHMYTLATSYEYGVVCGRQKNVLNLYAIVNAACSLHMWPMLSKWNSSVRMVKILLTWYIKVYILRFIMVVKILKSDSLQQIYAHFTFLVLNSIRLANVVTSLRTKNLHKSSLISYPLDTPFGHSLYDLGQWNGNLGHLCSSMQYSMFLQ